VKLELGAGRFAALAGAQCAEICARLRDDVAKKLQRQQQSTITVYPNQQQVTVKLLLASKCCPTHILQSGVPLKWPTYPQQFPLNKTYCYSRDFITFIIIINIFYVA